MDAPDDAGVLVGEFVDELLSPTLQAVVAIRKTQSDGINHFALMFGCPFEELWAT